MMRAVTALATLALCFVPMHQVEADFYNCYTRITPQADLSIITVIGRCSWTTFGVQDNSVKIRGEMTVTPSNLNTRCAGFGYCGMSLKPPYIASTYYRSTAAYTASQWDVQFDERTETDTVTTEAAANPNTTCGCSPIIISVRGDYHLTSVADGVVFDIDADGVAERVSWTAPGSDLAFLALDRNQNGRIDGGAELFGDAAAANGWEALGVLDANGDGVINANDAAWSALLLWYDRDHDGLSIPAELVPVASSSIVAIGTGYRWIGRRDAFGNMFRYAGEITLQAGRRQAYDVYFLGN